MITISAALDYLEAQYNPAIGLFHEAPNAAPTHYWYYNDLYLAQLALQGMPTGATDIQWPNLAVPRCRVLSGYVFKDGTVLAPDNIITISSLPNLIRTETPNLFATPYNVTQYADIAFYNVIHLFNQGQYSKARTALKTAEAMWDGNGWWDKSNSVVGNYGSYKCALYVIACRMLGVNGTYLTANINVMTMCQVFNRPNFSNQQGGISTNYISTGGILTNGYAGDTNIETTSLVVLASQ